MTKIVGFTDETYKGYEYCILFEYRTWAAYKGNPSFYDVLSIYLDCYPKAIRRSAEMSRYEELQRSRT